MCILRTKVHFLYFTFITVGSFVFLLIAKATTWDLWGGKVRQKYIYISFYLYKKYSKGWLKIPKRKLEKSTTLESFFFLYFFKKKQHKMEKCSPNKYKFPYFTSLQRVVKTTLLPNILFLLHGVSALLFLDTLRGNILFPTGLAKAAYIC